MNYLKSALVGLAAVFVIFGILPTFIALVRIFAFELQHSGAIGFGIEFGPVHWRPLSLTEWGLVFVVFAIAFLWKLRRPAK